MVRFLRITAICATILFYLAPIAQATPAAVEKEAPKPADTQMALSGPINARFVAAILVVASKHPDIHRLVIDSEGGYNEAALQLAQIVRDRGWDVVVKNKCLSACANFVFPAGKRKIVLPNSWVGIHNTRREFHQADGSVHSFSGNEIEAAMYSENIDSTLTFAARKRDNDTAKFYQALDLSTALHQDFANYVSSRKRVLGVEDIDRFPDVPGCPRYRAWALSKKQLEAMGVTGIDDFWFPKNKAEEGALYRDKLLPPGSIYIGGPEKLSTLCKGPALSWLRRLLLKREPKT